MKFKNLQIEYGDYQSRYRNTEEKIVYLSTELERYKNQFSKYQDYEIRIKQYEANSRDYDSRIAYIKKESEDNIKRLVEEIRNLNNTLRLKSEEVESLRSQYKQVEVRIYEINTLTQENKRLAEIISVKTREIEELRIRLSQQEGKVLQIKDYEGKIALLSTELERLRAAYSQRTAELDDVRKTSRTIVIKEYDDRILLLN